MRLIAAQVLKVSNDFDDNRRDEEPVLTCWLERSKIKPYWPRWTPHALPTPRVYIKLLEWTGPACSESDTTWRSQSYNDRINYKISEIPVILLLQCYGLVQQKYPQHGIIPDMLGSSLILEETTAINACACPQPTVI
ncbi:hypothetical protein NPIL_107511 [Nephila pilipes]|uniref:Uncharacterized protein n=1 Tax=Nephila pilipes TaxID=299642 RepID=A0A8X6U7H6_NEPPI|nr:hypothetical protein NPIL_107511 [Nephila pilipes]